MGYPKNESVSRSQAAVSSASWAFNQAGITFNEVGLEFGGSDPIQDIGPYMLQVDAIVPRNDSVEIE